MSGAEVEVVAEAAEVEVEVEVAEVEVEVEAGSLTANCFPLTANWICQPHKQRWRWRRWQRQTRRWRQR